jgi:hypothetical protein
VHHTPLCRASLRSACASVCFAAPTSASSRRARGAWRTALPDDRSCVRPLIARSDPPDRHAVSGHGGTHKNKAKQSSHAGNGVQVSVRPRCDREGFCSTPLDSWAWIRCLGVSKGGYLGDNPALPGGAADEAGIPEVAHHLKSGSQPNWKSLYWDQFNPISAEEARCTYSRLAYRVIVAHRSG